MRRLIVMMVMVMFFFTTMASSLDKTYSMIDKKITLTQNGVNQVEITLIKNSDYCFSECYAVFNVTINNDYINFSKIKFYNSKEDLVFKVYQSKGTEKTKEYPMKQTCTPTLGSQNGSNTCIWEEDKTKGKDTEGVIWEEVDKKANFQKGNYLIMLKTYKRFQDNVDWVVNIANTDLTEWAWWYTPSPTAYYRMDSDTTDLKGTHNLTTLGTAPTMDNANYKLGSGSRKYVGTGEDNHSVQKTDFNTGTRNFTVAFWINTTHVNAGDHDGVISTGGYGSANNWAIFMRGAGQANAGHIVISDNTQAVNSGTYLVNDGAWHRVVFVRNSTGTNGMQVYVDGALKGQGNFNNDKTGSVGLILGALAPEATRYTGLLDDILFYNTSAWTQADVTYDWNGGAGVEAYSDATSLSTPANNTIVFSENQSLGFTATTSITPINWTFYIWNSSGHVNYKLVNVTSSTTFSATVNISTLNHTANSTFKWSTFPCDASQCLAPPGNFTFYLSNFMEESQAYSATTYIGQVEKFIINVSYDPNSYSGILANLVYNGTSYAGTATTTADKASISKSISVPSSASQQNYTFYWVIALTNASGTSYSNSTIKTQTVNTFTIGACDGANTQLIVNYTLKDEVTQALFDKQEPPTTNISMLTYNGSIEVDMKLYSTDTGTHIINYSGNFTWTNFAGICSSISLASGTAYRMETQTKYSGAGYVGEYHYFQNYTLTNLTARQQVTLYDLLSADSTTFLTTYYDSNGVPVEGAIISLNRKYVSEGVFKTVEMYKTNSFGNGILHLDLDNGATYQIIVKLNGTTLSIFNDVTPYCKDRATGDCSIPLYATLATKLVTNWNTYYNLDYNLDFNETLRRVILTFVTSDGSSKKVSLNLTKADYLGTTVLCSDLLISSSGTITCDVPEIYKNVSFWTKVFIDEPAGGNFIQVTQRLYQINIKLTDAFDNNSAFIALIMFLTLPLMLLSTTLGVIGFSFVGLILGAVLLYTSKSILGAGSFLFWGIMAGLLIIWKIYKRGTG